MVGEQREQKLRHFARGHLIYRGIYAGRLSNGGQINERGSANLAQHSLYSHDIATNAITWVLQGSNVQTSVLGKSQPASNVHCDIRHTKDAVNNQADSVLRVTVKVSDAQSRAASVRTIASNLV